MPGPSKRRRLGGYNSCPDEACTAASVEEPHDQLEMWKRKAARQEEEVGTMRAQNVALRTENESLKSEIDRLKRLEDSLIAAVLAATRRS